MAQKTWWLRKYEGTQRLHEEMEDYYKEEKEVINCRDFNCFLNGRFLIKPPVLIGYFIFQFFMVK